MDKTIRKNEIKHKLVHYANSAFALLYPERCPVCGTLLEYGGRKICKGCVSKLHFLESPLCLKCGKEVFDEEIELCADCSTDKKHYEKGYPALAYEGEIKKTLYDFKYKGARCDADFLAACIMKRHGEELAALSVDAIIPVPMYGKKQRKRGYNQAAVLAKALSKRLSVPVCDKVLIRINDTKPQKELNDKARMKNLKNAFIVKKNTIKLNKVLLVDDIYTSGATIESCTLALKEAGVEKVYYTSVAIGKGY